MKLAEIRWARTRDELLLMFVASPRQCLLIIHREAFGETKALGSRGGASSVREIPARGARPLFRHGQELPLRLARVRRLLRVFVVRGGVGGRALLASLRHDVDHHTVQDASEERSGTEAGFDQQISGVGEAIPLLGWIRDWFLGLGEGCEAGSDGGVATPASAGQGRGGAGFGGREIREPTGPRPERWHSKSRMSIVPQYSSI